MNSFDVISKNYDNSVLDIPIEYKELIKNNIQLSPYSKVIEVACGTGLLTVHLSKIFSNILAFDCSQQMLNLAKNKYSTDSIIWTFDTAENFNYENTDLIIAFEAFHLISKPEDVIIKMFNSLNNNGYIAIGWCIFFWENILKEEIKRVFSQYGIEYKEYFQDCSFLLNKIDFKRDNPVNLAKISVQTEITLEQISIYLSSISIVTNLSQDKRECLQKDLLNEFINKFKSKYIQGTSQYFLQFIQKH